MGKQDVLDQLVSMSCALGMPERDCVILGEGNTSARVDEKSYYVKASGFQLNGIQGQGFVELCFEPVLDMLDRQNLDDAETNRLLAAAKMDPSVQVRPSIEAPMHAVIFDVGGAGFIGHTHPTAVNAILCAQNGPELLHGRLFPDHIVFCGAAPAYIPYVEPGLPLARAVRRTLEEYLDAHGTAPKTIFMQNHGLIAVGRTAVEVDSITAMCVKSCRVLQATAAFGGPHFMSDEDVRVIYKHPGELYRRKQAGLND
jgi:rhamnose utilization protein RhaD (predicted bifunctional aldolase and dehydrogenase)